MLALTPSERRGARVLVLLLLIGAGHDLWRARERIPGPADLRAARPELRPQPVRSDSEPGLPAGAAPAPDSAASGTAPARSPEPVRRAPIDLNRAGARELDALPGIGPVIAGRIVQQRRRFGPFQGVDELLAVRGVGPRLLERIRPWATVGPLRGAAPSGAIERPDSAMKTLP